MKITVKNVKVAQFASEETLCFEATVYIDGKRGFTAHNQGHGGSNMYYPIKKGDDFDRSLLDAAEEWVKKQPEIVCDDMNDPNDPEKPFSYQPCLDHFVDKAVNEFQNEKELKKVLKKALIFDGSKIFSYNCKIDHPKIREQIKKNNPDAVIMNDLPLDEALEIFMKYG